MSSADPASDTTGELEITKVVIDLTMGLFAFIYTDGITEHIQIRDHTELPTVSNFVTALTKKSPATADRSAASNPSPPPQPQTSRRLLHNGLPLPRLHRRPRTSDPTMGSAHG